MVNDKAKNSNYSKCTRYSSLSLYTVKNIMGDLIFWQHLFPPFLVIKFCLCKYDFRYTACFIGQLNVKYLCKRGRMKIGWYGIFKCMGNNIDLNASFMLDIIDLIKLSFLGILFVVPMTWIERHCSNSICCNVLEMLSLFKWSISCHKLLFSNLSC